jgi:hypothetical protein
MKTLALAFAVIVPTALFSDTIKPNYAGCVTKASLSELLTAANANDLRQIDALMDANICFPIGGREFSVIEQGLVTSKVRVYAGSSSAVLYLPTEGTR